MIVGTMNDKPCKVCKRLLSFVWMYHCWECLEALCVLHVRSSDGRALCGRCLGKLK